VVIVNLPHPPSSSFLPSIAFDPSGNLYVSCQHTNTVLRYDKDTFAPLPLPQTLQHVPIIDEEKAKSDVVPSVHTALFEGTFFQYEVFPKKKKKHKRKKKKKKKWDEEPKEGVRDLGFVGEDLWIACEDIKGVSVVNPEGVEVRARAFALINC
jgi:hypothetical protein